MFPHYKATIASVCVVFFILRAAGDRTSFDTVAYRRACESHLLFNIVYANGTANHAFQLRYTNNLITATDNCTAGTMWISPEIDGVDIATEIAFLRRQWSGLKQAASMSPLGKMRLTLSYRFDPYTINYEFRLSSGGMTMVHCCTDNVPFFNGQYRHDKLAQACGYGIAVDVIRKKLRDLGKKWDRCCLQIEANGSCAITSRGKQGLTSIGPHLTSVIGTERMTVTESADAIGNKNALAAKDTGYIVMPVVVVVAIAVLAVIAWKKGETLRNRFRRVTSR